MSTSPEFTYTLKLAHNAQVELLRSQAVRLCAYIYLNQDYAFTHSYEKGAELLDAQDNVTVTLEDGSVLTKEPA